MNTEAFKINLAKRIFDISDERILEKINQLLKTESIVGYRPNGQPITESDFIAEMDAQQERIENGTAKFYSTEEVRQKILNEGNLGR